MLTVEQSKAIIKFCVLDQNFLQRVRKVLNPASVTSGTHREILAVLYDNLDKKHKHPTMNDLDYIVDAWRDKLDGQRRVEQENGVDRDRISADIQEIKNLEVDADVFHDKIAEILKAEALKYHVKRISTAGTANVKDVQEVMVSLGNAMKFESDSRDLSPAHQKLDMVMKPESRVICSRTPWPSINEAVKGGLARGEYGVVLAYSNVGKSTLLCALGYHALTTKKNVLHITAEDSERETLVKYVSLHTQENRDAIDRGTAPAAIEKFKSDSIRGEIGTLYTYETLEYHTKASQIEHIINDYETKFTTKIDVLIVDYAQIMKPESTSEDESQGDWKQIEDIHRTLRKVGRICDVATWSAHQAKEADKRERILKLQHMGKAKACGQVPEIMISLNEGEGDAEDALNNQVLFIARNRLGAKNVQVNLRVNHKKISYVEV